MSLNQALPDETFTTTLDRDNLSSTCAEHSGDDKAASSGRGKTRFMSTSAILPPLTSVSLTMEPEVSIETLSFAARGAGERIRISPRAF